MDSVLEHVDDPISLLKVMNHILKPNGVGFLIVPNEDSLINDTKKLLYSLMLKKSEFGRIKPFVPPYHINGFNCRSLKYAIEVAGFKVIKVSQFAGNYKFWKDDNHAILLDNAKMMQQKLDYLHNNPVVAEIVEEPHEYIYSSAKFYSDELSLIQCERI